MLCKCFLIYTGVLLMVLLGIAVGVVVGALLLCLIAKFTRRCVDRCRCRVQEQLDLLFYLPQFKFVLFPPNHLIVNYAAFIVQYGN